MSLLRSFLVAVSIVLHLCSATKTYFQGNAFAAFEYNKSIGAMIIPETTYTLHFEFFITNRTQNAFNPLITFGDVSHSIRSPGTWIDEDTDYLHISYTPLMPGFNIGCDANHQINATKIELNILYTVDIVISQNITANSSFMEGYIDGTFQCGSYGNPALYNVGQLSDVFATHDQGTQATGFYRNVYIYEETLSPTEIPTATPTAIPTAIPTTVFPTNAPSKSNSIASTNYYQPTANPVSMPTMSPSMQDKEQGGSWKYDTANEDGLVNIIIALICVFGVLLAAVFIGLACCYYKFKTHHELVAGDENL